MSEPDTKGESKQSRRDFLLTASATATGLVLAPALLPRGLDASAARPGTMRIGIIGSGLIGGAVGLQWARAGHEILFSSRHPEELMDLVQSAAPRASAGYADAAAYFGDVILLAVPPGAIPQIGEDIGHLMQGKVVIDLTNPRADRDGPLTDEWLEMGTGLAMAQYLPGARLVKAFNSLGARMLANPIGRSGEKIGVPIAGDDAEARDIVADLVRDTGLEPVMVGRLERAKEFDRGSPVWVSGQSAAQLREALNLR